MTTNIPAPGAPDLWPHVSLPHAPGTPLRGLHRDHGVLPTGGAL